MCFVEKGEYQIQLAVSGFEKKKNLTKNTQSFPFLSAVAVTCSL